MGKTAGPIAYSDSRLKTLQRCLKQYEYTYIDNKPELEIMSPDMFKGIFFHKMFELSWEIDGDIGRLKQKYHSRDTFIRASQGYFKRQFSRGYCREVKIDWKDKKDQWKFLYGGAKDILGTYYHLSQAECPPLAVEIPFKAVINDFILVGVIDEIRRNFSGLVIRDHKYYPAGLGDMHLKLDPQLTLYAVVLTADLTHYGPISRKYLKIDEKTAKELAGKELISDKIGLEYHLIEERHRVISVTRRFEHLADFKKNLEANKQKLEYAQFTGNFAAERGGHCEECPARLRCEKDTLEKRAQTELLNVSSLEIDGYFREKRVLKEKKREARKKIKRIPFPRKKKSRAQIEIRL